MCAVKERLLFSYQLYDFALFLQSSCRSINPDTDRHQFGWQKSSPLMQPLHLSGATSPAAWSSLCMQSEKECKERKYKEHHRDIKKKKITGGYVDVKATAFIDCSSSGNMTAASEVKCSGSRAAKELSSFTRICVSVRWPCGLCKRKTGNQAEWRQWSLVDEEWLQ